MTNLTAGDTHAIIPPIPPDKAVSVLADRRTPEQKTKAIERLERDLKTQKKKLEELEEMGIDTTWLKDHFKILNASRDTDDEFTGFLDDRRKEKKRDW